MHHTIFQISKPYISFVNMEYNEENLEWTSGHFSSLSDNIHPNIPHPKPVGALKSYPPSSHMLGPESNLSSHHGSLNTLQISLIALKDRCLKQQRKIDLLEDENSRLYYALGVSDLPQNEEIAKNSTAATNNDQNEHLEALNRLQEANFLLRQRNLELNQKVIKASSSSSVKCKCEKKVEVENKQPSNKTDNFTNYNPSRRKSKSTAKVNGVIGANSDEDDQEEDIQIEEEMVDYSRKDSNKSYDRIQLTEQNMQELKQQLLSQQKIMLNAVKSITTSLNNKSGALKGDLHIHTEEMDHSSQQTDNSSVFDSNNTKEVKNPEINLRMLSNDHNSNERLCPMCEANFPQDLILQEDFEAHVLGHFSYEREAETLTNYDMVLDAQRALDGDL